jgi:hypothetical protein
MKTSRVAEVKSAFIREIRSSIPFLLMVAPLLVGAAFAQQKLSLGDNAALRYYAAFAQMRDYAITDAEAKKLNGILDGPVPYDDSQYKDLVEKNKPALETLARGAALPQCDWGLDYIGEDTPVDYARNALALGRLNVLYAFHLMIAGDKAAAVSAIKAGLRFSQDVANGGSLFATLAAKSLLLTHLRAIAFVRSAAIGAAKGSRTPRRRRSRLAIRGETRSRSPAWTLLQRPPSFRCPYPDNFVLPSRSQRAQSAKPGRTPRPAAATCQPAPQPQSRLGRKARPEQSPRAGARTTAMSEGKIEWPILARSVRQSLP